MTDQTSVPKPLLALVAIVLLALLVASAITGQWLILILGVIGVGALAVPFATKR